MHAGASPIALPQPVRSALVDLNHTGDAFLKRQTAAQSLEREHIHLHA